MAIYHPAFKPLYFAAWGTGSSSVIQALIEQLDAIQIPEDDIRTSATNKMICPSKHTTPAQLKAANIID